MKLRVKKSFRVFVGVVALAAMASHGAALAAPEPLGEQRPEALGSATLSAEQIAKLKAILAPYKAATLKPDDAKAIKRALRDAGMRPGPALDKALANSGFSAERLEALDPRPARMAVEHDAPTGPPPRR
jgi:hypothetical protein